MAGERILIVDDTAVNLKLTRILLVNEGFSVITAGSAEEALDLLPAAQPRLILADIQLPGMDGLEMTRRIKQDPRTREILVIAVTAFAMKADEQKAVEAGCDGYITKPIDTRALGAQIRRWLDHQDESAVSAHEVQTEAIPALELHSLRQRFLQEGQGQARRILASLDGVFDAAGASRVVHQWIGTAGLLGFSDLSALAREVETVLRERPLDAAQVRDSLTLLLFEFHLPPESREAPFPDALIDGLRGRCIATTGLPASQARRLAIALQRAGATSRVFAPGSLDQGKLTGCDLVAAYVPPGGIDEAWLGSARRFVPSAIFIGDREDILTLPADMRAQSAGLLMDSWQPDEALLRLSLAVSGLSVQGLPPPAEAHHRLCVVVADPDPVTIGSLATMLPSFDMQAVPAATGSALLDSIQRHEPDAAVVNVSLPEIANGALLAALRREGSTVPVLLTASPGQENELARAFKSGAGDYALTPCNPLELVARLQRLLCV